MSEVPPTLAARNAAIHAAEAAFRERAASIVSLVLRRAHGGDPVCLRLCLERALPAGRIPPPVELAPDYDPGNLKRVFGAIGAALDDGRINTRQASRLLDALGALGLDDFITVAPRAPGGILEHRQTNTEETP